MLVVVLEEEKEEEKGRLGTDDSFFRNFGVSSQPLQLHALYWTCVEGHASS